MSGSGARRLEKKNAAVPEGAAAVETEPIEVGAAQCGMLV